MIVKRLVNKEVRRNRLYLKAKDNETRMNEVVVVRPKSFDFKALDKDEPCINNKKFWNQLDAFNFDSLAIHVLMNEKV